MEASVSILVMGELNDFLERSKRYRPIQYFPDRHPAVKDVLESIGIPHTEIRLIRINGLPVALTQQVSEGDIVEVFPVGVCPEGGAEHILPFKPEELKFVLDVHLGGLARWLRLAGIDVLYQWKDPGDALLAQIASREDRVLLTRDINLLKRSIVKYGYWLRKTGSRNQFHEIVDRYDLKPLFKPFSRCVHCNEMIEPVEKSEIAGQVKADTLSYYQQFWRCPSCEHIYWKGSHFRKIENVLFG